LATLRRPNSRIKKYISAIISTTYTELRLRPVRCLTSGQSPPRSPPYHLSGAPR
jgi:hypothetical protein